MRSSAFTSAFIILLCVFIYASANAQFSLGLKAGLNLSTLSADDGESDYGFLPGFQAGGFADYAKDKLSFQLDLLYSQQGASIKAGGEKLKVVAKYVNIPLVVKYKVSPSIYIELGPQVGFLTCMDSDYHPIVHEPFEKQNYTKAYKKTDFGINIGAGWETTKGLMIDLRYYQGLADISDYEGLPSTRNSVIQLTAGYKMFRR